MDSWWKVLQSKTTNEYNKNQEEFKANEAIPESCKTYVYKTQLIEYKEKFVEAWTNKALHLGTINSS